MGNLPISRPAVCVSVAAWIRRRLALSSAASASARRKAQKFRPLACVLIFGRRFKITRRAIMVPNAWLGVTSSWLVITNTRFAFWVSNALGIAQCHLHVLTPMAVEEYGIDVLFCAYSLVVASDLAFCVGQGGCYVTGTYNDPLRENKKHTLKKEEREREMTTMMMMMDQTRVVLYQYIHYEHVSTLYQNERGRLRGVVGIRSGNRSHPPLPSKQVRSFEAEKRVRVYKIASDTFPSNT